MARGGSGVLAAAALAIAIVGLLVAARAPLGEAAAAAYAVGDNGGWRPNVAWWASRRTFRDGDLLVFSYDPAAHDVAIVDEAAYRSCVVPSGARVLRSGRDRLRLARGTHYFVCTVRAHCQNGMKLAVRAV